MGFLSRRHLSLIEKTKTYHNPLLKSRSKWTCQSPGHTTLFRKAVCSGGFRHSIKPDRNMNQHKGLSGCCPLPSCECWDLQWALWPLSSLNLEVIPTYSLTKRPQWPSSQREATQGAGGSCAIRASKQNCFEPRNNWKTELM